jgi:DNA-binding NarL/FixJ family response regulator
MTQEKRSSNRFDLRANDFKNRTKVINSLLSQYNIVAATGSLLEAHLLARLGVSGGLPNLVGCGTDVNEVRQLCSNLRNVLLFMTESISSYYGADLIDMLRSELNTIKIFYLLQDGCIANRIRTFDTDAVLMTTSFGTGAVAVALSEITSGRRYFDPAYLRFLSQSKVILTKREQQVLQFLRIGLTNKEISAQLSISPVTVRDYVQNLMVKLNATNRTMVVVNAGKFGLI